VCDWVPIVRGHQILFPHFGISCAHFYDFLIKCQGVSAVCHDMP